MIPTSKFSLLNSISIGSWITLGHPAIAEIMANAGFDWLTVDLEHSVITIREAEDLIRIIGLKGVVPLVRLSSKNSEQIKRVMDAGASGIIAPMVNTAEDAEYVVNAVKYPPKGQRGVGLARAQGYGALFDEYKEWQEDNAIVIVQIEHIKAVDNIDSILTVDGIDGLIIGPYDLSGSMGIPGDFNSQKFVQALERIRSASVELDIPAGIHVVEPNPEDVLRQISAGYKFIAYSLDIRLLDVASRNGLKKIRKAIK